MSSRGPMYNSAGYKDMTAFIAIEKADRELEKKARKKGEYPKVYICSPFKGDKGANAEKAKRYCRFAFDRKKRPVAPHCFYPLFMDDDIPEERRLAMSFGADDLKHCEELWIFGNKISEGMKEEIRAARKMHIKLRHFNEDMEEIIY